MIFLIQKIHNGERQQLWKVVSQATADRDFREFKCNRKLEEFLCQCRSSETFSAIEWGFLPRLHDAACSRRTHSWPIPSLLAEIP